MKISELIKQLEEYQKKNGDVILYSEKDDGRSSWVSLIKPKLEFCATYPDLKVMKHFISVTGGY